jgi:hypothetical protein
MTTQSMASGCLSAQTQKVASTFLHARFTHKVIICVYKGTIALLHNKKGGVLRTHPQIQQPQEQSLLGEAEASKVRLEYCLSFVVGPCDAPPSRILALAASVFLRILAVTRVFLGMPSSSLLAAVAVAAVVGVAAAAAVVAAAAAAAAAAAVLGKLTARLLLSLSSSLLPLLSLRLPLSGKSLPLDMTVAFAAP